MFRILGIIAASALLPGTAFAASGNSKTSTGTAAVQTVEPVVLTHWTSFSLRFGKFSVASAGTVTVTPSGGASSAGGVSFVAGSVTGTDRFLVQGETNRQVSITTGSGTVSSGGASMAFTTTPSVATGLIPWPGQGFFTVGGTLSVSAGQPGGDYSGSYPVTVAYN